MRAMILRKDEGVFCAVVGKPGRIFTPYVRIHSPKTGPFVKKFKMANGDMELYSKPMLKGIDPYPLKRVANHFLRIGRKSGITKGARKFLMDAKHEG